MNKREFLDLLRYYLSAYPENMINDIVNDYEEHFHIGMEKGKTETQISEELGSPKDIADEFLNNQRPPSPNFVIDNKGFQDNCGNNSYNNANMQQSTKKETSVITIILIVVGAIILGPPVLGVGVAIILTILAVIFALLVSVAAVAVSGVAISVSNFIPINNFLGIMGYIPNPLTSFLLGIFLISLAILIFYLLILFIKLVIKGIKKLYLSIRWRILKRRNEK